MKDAPASVASIPTLTIDDFYSVRGSVRPGEPASLELALTNRGNPVTVRILVELLDNGITVASSTVEAPLGRGESFVRLEVPTEATRVAGYLAAVQVHAPGDVHPGHTAVLAIDHWAQAPRYGFLSQFDKLAENRRPVNELAKSGITVVQFYDWMYRHYRFLPPEDEFIDAMGRELSISTVRRRIDECHEHGIWAIAYGAVYGAEAEYVADRPELVLYDGRGRSLSLIDRFYINDIRAGSEWRENILSEFAGAVSELGFDGIHMDQYGFPKWSFDVSGAPVDLSDEFGPLIDEAAKRVADIRPDAAVLFNAVNAWPLEEVAAAHQAAVYIEVWPPFELYRHLVDLIRRARQLGRKQVILAAYLEPFRTPGPGADNSALLATAVIAAAGGFHLLLGEGDKVLRDPYYPNHGQLEGHFALTLRRYYEHTAACHDYLYPLDLSDVTDTFAGGVNGEIALSGADWSVEPREGVVWLAVRKRSDDRRKQLVVNLVNLNGVEDDRWNAPKEAPLPVSECALLLSVHFKPARITWASPDSSIHPVELTWDEGEGGLRVPLPELMVWSTVIIDLH